MRRLLIVACVAAWVAAPGVVRADEVGDEELPWWAEADYPEEPAPEVAAAPDLAAAAPPNVDPTDTTWWAGGPDAVLALKGGEPLPEEREEAGSAEEPRETTDESDDGGRNPLYRRAEGHRAGEEPSEGSAGGEGIEIEEADDRDANQCNRYLKQIARYEAELEIAKQHGNELAERNLEAQIERLEHREETRCPQEPEGPSKLLIALHYLGKAVKLGAKVARMMYGSPW